MKRLIMFLAAARVTFMPCHPATEEPSARWQPGTTDWKGKTNLSVGD